MKFAQQAKTIDNLIGNLESHGLIIGNTKMAKRYLTNTGFPDNWFIDVFWGE